jgi:hypothetical protein
MYLCVRVSIFATFYDFAIGFWSCPYSVVFFVFLLDFGAVLTVWYFLLDFGAVLTVWYFSIDFGAVLTVVFFYRF